MKLSRRGRARVFAGLVLVLALGGVTAGGQDAGPPSEAPHLARIREGFYGAVEDPAATGALEAYIKSRFPTPPEELPPVVLAYLAAVEGLKGRHDANVFRKYQHVKAAIELFEPLVQAYPGNLEVRFLRFAFYHQIPALFGVRAQVPKDLEACLRLLEQEPQAQVPRSLRQDMVSYLLRSGEATGEQRKRLERLSILMREP